MRAPKLTVAVLTGQETAACRVIASLCSLEGVSVKGILLDVAQAPLRVRARHLRRNVRREGPAYLVHRLGRFIEGRLEGMAARVVSRPAAEALLGEAFPDQPPSLSALSARYDVPVLRVGNLNDGPAAQALRELDVDLGVVIGTRILRRSTFSIPRLGSVNLHKGRVPDYRGLPPGFWEIYDGCTEAGVTVHFVDDRLDTGDIVGEDTVPVHPRDTPVTLARKFDAAGDALLVRSVRAFAAGEVSRRPQAPFAGKARTAPTQEQRREVDRRLQVRPRQFHVAKTLLYLAFYYTGLLRAVRVARRLIGSRKACVLLYHRVNDRSEDVLTTSVERFAEHMVSLRGHYAVVSTADLVRSIKSGAALPPNAIVIHFDDCYKDVQTNASRILDCLRYPACCFVSSGFVGTGRTFDHDADSPVALENLNEQDLVLLSERGFEIGSHTVNHVDLGQCGHNEACDEVTLCKQDLERAAGTMVRFFSYPFGGRHHIRAETAALIPNAGYEAMFSAYGGYVGRDADPYDIPRVGVHGAFRPLDLLMEIEGLSLGALARKAQAIWNTLAVRRPTATEAG